ncbi:putative F-box protein At5g15670 isoform X2 [Rhododendron vialii]|uniref:putative F-box protein At5g15670 isoform X2 n=1 Tax=Rhododendron vialii TaxID=182163 RepID=UPI00265E2A7F|nr:putative F-box protein At5g15670 isoform X2 [Rhododendron vialii]
MAKKVRANVDELPKDVLMNILSRIPVKSLLRFKSVSKFWSLLKKYCHGGSCNGLICLFNKSTIVICNPALREFRLLPQPPYRTFHTTYLGFAFVPTINDYVVVRLATRRGSDIKPIEHKVHIYIMRNDTWKQIIATVPNYFINPCPSPCTSLDGVFYWLCDDSSTGLKIKVKVIGALNTIEESFERISLPVSICNGFYLCLLYDSLALVGSKDCACFDIWLMDKYKVEECWTKKYTFGPLLGCDIVFGFWPNNEILVSGGNDCWEFVSYNFSTHDMKKYKQLCGWPQPLELSQVFPYSESLVSVKRRVDLHVAKTRRRR